MSIKNPLSPAGIEPATFQFLTQHLNHCATAIPDGTQNAKKYSGEFRGRRSVGRPGLRFADKIGRDIYKNQSVNSAQNTELLNVEAGCTESTGILISP